MARRVDRVKLRREIILKIRGEKSIRGHTKRQAEQVADYWKNVAWPMSTGSVYSPPNHPWSQGGPDGYAESIEVRQGRRRGGRFAGRFLSHYEVRTDHPNANFIEFGTARDKPGSRSPWGPNTPTPEYAPAAKTAHHFRGTAP